MCDELTEKDNEEYLRKNGKMNRRDFGKISTIAAFSAMLPITGCAQTATEEGSIVESTVDVKMADGISDCYFVHPAKGTHPGILMWPDIKGLRPAFKAMGKRLAQSGYSVGDVPDFSDPPTRKLLIGMARKLTQDASMSDARAYIDFIDQQASTDTSRKIGTCGYCMGGPLIMRTAGAVPDRVGAAASFHGGGLVTDREDSPHLLIPNSPAHVLHAVAENDDEKNPTQKTVLAESYKAAGVPAEIEVYAGTKHGWCPPDSTVYNEVQAEKAWSRMLALYKTALG
jgi:carboxymethylenebutenolidase